MLARLGADGAAREILAINPGVPAAPAGPGWSYLGFKGGSEPGVLAGAWLHERNGVRHVTVGMVANPHARIDQDEAIQLLATLRDACRRSRSRDLASVAAHGFRDQQAEREGGGGGGHWMARG